jgi:hypothetical protein
MSEAAATVTSSADTSVVSEQTVSEDVTQFIGEDGSFKDGWIEGLVPEDLRNEIVFRDMAKTNPNIRDSLKMLANAERAIGKKGLIVPTDSSTPSEWDAFYKTLGRPDKPNGYKLEYPKDMPVDEVPELKTAWMNEAHKLGYSQKQAEGAYGFYNNLVKQALIQNEQQKEQQKIDAETQLKTELGAEYDNYIHIGNRMISENTQEGEQRDNFLQKFGNDPDFIKFVGTIGKKFMEHKGIPAGAEKQTGMSLSEAKSKMDEIAKTLADTTLVYKNPGLHARLTAEMAGLAKLVSPK